MKTFTSAYFLERKKRGGATLNTHLDAPRILLVTLFLEPCLKLATEFTFIMHGLLLKCGFP